MYLKSFASIILLQAYHIQSAVLNKGNACDNGAGECKVLLECQPLIDNFNIIFSKAKFCDDENSIICCPKAKTVVTSEVKSGEALRKCIQYKTTAEKYCDAQGLIVGGTKAQSGEFPHMALIGVHHAHTGIYWICGGTLISKQFIVTAAHCFFHNEIPNYVRLGELDYNSTNDGAQPQDFFIKTYLAHPEYNPFEKYNDIALAMLDGEGANFNRYVYPACLPISNEIEVPNFIATGWGATGFAFENSTHLLKVNLRQFTDEECKTLIGESLSLSRGVHRKTQLCAGSKITKADTCQGDSGGPLFVHHPDYSCMYLLFGVTSFGFGCGITGSPGVYTRVNYFLKWIESTVWNTTIELS